MDPTHGWLEGIRRPGSVTEDGMMTVGQVCEFLSLGGTKVRQLIRQGVLPKCKFGRVLRVPRRAVVAYAEAQLNQAPSA
jgi:excisionase family DNA binding protein